jgi:hypothetical protein
MTKENPETEMPVDERDVNVSQFGRDVSRQTLLGRAQALEALDLAGGRFGQLAKSTIVGATPTPAYGASPQWSIDQGLVPDEPPIGIDIEAVADTTKVP